jgi:ABC-2 type transport system ATP-binding protein
MITAFLEPSSGEILFDGAPIQRDLIAYKQRIGYVPEEPHLYAHLSGLEYLGMLANCETWPRNPPPSASMALVTLELPDNRP